MSQPQDKDQLSAEAHLPGSSSVAHQIIEAFLVSLELAEGYGSISKNLRKAVFEKKPSEANLRSALFGEDVL